MFNLVWDKVEIKLLLEKKVLARKDCVWPLQEFCVRRPCYMELHRTLNIKTSAGNTKANKQRKDYFTECQLARSAHRVAPHPVLYQLSSKAATVSPPKEEKGEWRKTYKCTNHSNNKESNDKNKQEDTT